MSGVFSLHGANEDPQLSSLTSQMAFWSDGTISGNQLIDKSGNGRHGVIGDNIITNGGAELGAMLTEWNVGRPADINAVSTVEFRSGSKSFEVAIVSAVTSSGVFTGNRFTTVTGETVNYSFWIKKTVTGSISLAIGRGSGSGFIVTTSINPTLNTWVNITGSYTETASGNRAYIALYINSGSVSFFLDDIQVTIVGKLNIGVSMANDAVLKAIDSNNHFYSAAGVPTVFRSDIEGRGFFNRKIFVKDGKSYMWFTNLPSVNTRHVVYKKFVDPLWVFNSCDVVYRIKADGTGDYLTIQAAITAIGGANGAYNKRYRLDIYDDVVNVSQGVQITMQPFIYLNGVGAMKAISANIPTSSSDAQTNASDNFYAVYSGGANNIKFTMRNGKYAMHLDSSSSANAFHHFNNCEFWHYSNQQVIEYRIANSLPYAGVRKGINAIGSGCWNNETAIFTGCKMYGIQPFFWHTNQPAFSIKAIFDVYNCALVSQAIYEANGNPTSAILDNVYLQPSQNGFFSEFNLIACRCNATATYISNYASPLTNIYLNNDIAFSTCKTSISFVNTFTSGGSLRITGTPGAVVITGGTAQSLIMPSPDYSGDTATGRLEVGEWPLNQSVKLGARLGDCSSVNKTLTMTIGGIAKTVTFNQNHTAQSNATILGFINTALAGSGTASLYQRASEYLPTVYY